MIRTARDNARPMTKRGGLTGDDPPPKRVHWLAVAGSFFSLVCLLLLFVWVPVDDTLVALLKGDPFLLALASMATIGNLGLRGVRWMALLGRHTLRDLRLATTISMAGLALNATLPGKAGEIARVGLAARWMRIRVGEAGMASLIERVIDLAVLSGLGFATLALAGRWSEDPNGAFSRETLVSLAVSLLVMSLSATALILMASHDRLGKWVQQTVSSWLATPKWRRRVRRFLLDVRNGAVRIRSPRAALSALASTLGLWGILGAGVYAVGLAMPGIECTPLAAVAFAVVTTLASALPSAPGAWGVYEAAGVVVGSTLITADSPSSLAAFVISSHATQYVPVVLIGLGCWIGLARRSADSFEHTDAGRVGPDRELGA